MKSISSFGIGDNTSVDEDVKFLFATNISVYNLSVYITADVSGEC